MKIELVVKAYDALPCHLREFTINGEEAFVEDFGERILSEGSCMDNECGCEFAPKPATKEVLEKYGIDEEDYRDICDALEEELYVCGCGWCS